MYGYLQNRKETLGWKLLSGTVLGLISIGLMMNPWQLGPGVFFDTRTILMSVGGLFLGITSMLPAMSLGSLYRLYVGGEGALTGVLWILGSGSLGLIWAKLRKDPTYQFSTSEFYLFGAGVHILMLMLMLTMPNNMGIPIIQRISLPVMLIFPLGTVLLAKLLANQELQQHNRTILDASERKYRELVNNSQAIILRFDLEGRITFFNEYAQKFFGYREDEIIGQKLTDTIIPAEKPVQHDFETMLAQLRQNPGSQTTHENDNICRDARRVTILWKNSPVMESVCETRGFQSVGHDVTEQRKVEASLQAAEQQFRQLIDVSPIPLAILQNNQTMVYLNRRFTEVFGYTLEDLPTVEAWWNKVYPEQSYRQEIRQKWIEAATKTIIHGAEFAPQEAQVTCKNGTVLDVIASLAAIGNQEIVVLTDMSRERQLDRLKSEFIATAAHELNTPLCSVMGFSELLLNDDDLDRASQKEYLAIVLDKTEALERIIDDLLELSRAGDTQNVSIEKQTCDLHELIDNALNSYRKEHAGRRFDLNWPDPGPAPFPFDRFKIGQVFENLLSNAIKFSLANTPVEISVTNTNREVRVSVSDRGCGMTAEQTAKVFERFYRVDMSDTAIPGLGLGLSIVKGIIEAHDGTIDIDSSQGLGTTVSFTLPHL